MLNPNYVERLIKMLDYNKNNLLTFPQNLHLTTCTAYINAGIALSYLGYKRGGVYLDLGCGFSLMKSFLPKDVFYIGVDRVSISTEKLMHGVSKCDMFSYLEKQDFSIKPVDFVLSTGAVSNISDEDFIKFQDLIFNKIRPIKIIILGSLSSGDIREDNIVMSPYYRHQIIESSHDLPFVAINIRRKGVVFTRLA